MLGIEELLELEESLRDELNERLEEIIVKLNRTGELETFLKLIDMSDLLGRHCDESNSNDGKIIVIGQSEVGKEKLAAVAKGLGIEKERFEFYLDYEEAKTFNFKKMQYSTGYSLVLVGPMPHSGNGKGEYSSVIAALEQEDGFPPVVRLGTNGLKITKTSFRNALKNMMVEKRIA